MRIPPGVKFPRPSPGDIARLLQDNLGEGFLLGVVTYYMLAGTNLLELIVPTDQPSLKVLALLSMINGVATSASALGLRALFGRLVRRGPLGPALTFFIAGAAAPLAISHWVVWAITIIICVLTFHNLRRFTHDLRLMLTPGRVARGEDVAELAQVALNVLAAFTVVNLSLDVLSEHLPGLTDAFEFSPGPGRIADALYFTVVLMTTLGFGDITPLSSLARLVVAAECLTGYIMFALIVGVLTRGIQPREFADNPPDEKSRD